MLTMDHIAGNPQIWRDQIGNKRADLPRLFSHTGLLWLLDRVHGGSAAGNRQQHLALVRRLVDHPERSGFVSDGSLSSIEWYFTRANDRVQRRAVNQDRKG